MSHDLEAAPRGWAGGSSAATQHHASGPHMPKGCPAAPVHGTRSHPERQERAKRGRTAQRGSLVQEDDCWARVCRPEKRPVAELLPVLSSHEG